MGFFEKIACLTSGQQQHKEKKPLPRPQKIKKERQKLTFLKPCPVYNGILFINGKTGDFFCEKCWPGLSGQPVLAAGKSEKHGLVMRENLPAKLNNTQYKNFEAGLPWIWENLSYLEKCGWDRPSLFRRSKTKYPTGNWGLAWLGPWKEKELTIHIENTGRIIFTYTSNGRKITKSIAKTCSINSPAYKGECAI